MSSNRTIGVIGLGVMGRNIAFNLMSQGTSVSAYSYSVSERDAFVADASAGVKTTSENVPGNLPDFVASLEVPRTILMMVTAGEAVDQVIADLRPLLAAGDILIDGGNSHYKDTGRREQLLQAEGIRYLGAGISGGEAGARSGASLMVGGSEAAFKAAESIFSALSIEVDGHHCYGYLGAAGAGHFVKMVHNGIEYGVMQLIAEAYYLLRYQLGFSNQQIADTFADWNKGKLRSYLMGITADIFRYRDEQGSGDLIDVISDRAGQKGTGRWTVDAAMELGVPVPGIIAAVTERQISGLLIRRSADATPSVGQGVADGSQHSIESALYAAVLSVYVQGMSLIDAASREYEWHTDSGLVLGLWRGGCIIRADLLDTLKQSLNENAEHPLLRAHTIRREIEPRMSDWRSVVAAGTSAGLATPAMSACLNYVSSLGTSSLPLNLVQAQRDYFGAHQYERIDQSGSFHTDWLNGTSADTSNKG